MKSTLNKTSDVNATIVIEIEKADYQPQVEKSLNQFRQKASIPGFRQGKVPKGVVQKMYGKSVLAEEINKLVSEELGNFIHKNNLRILGEPVPTEGNDKPLNLDKDENFTFYFDIALTPEFDLALDKNSHLTYYDVKIDDDILDKQITGYKQGLGTHEKVKTDIQVTDLLKGTLTELKGGKKKKNGMVVEDAVLMPSYMKNDDIVNGFIGKKIGDEVIFHPKTAYADNHAEVASLLQTTKEDVENLDSEFRMKIKEITRYKEADLNQDLFDKVFGKDAVKTEEEFRSKLTETLSGQFKPNADYLFLRDAKELILDKMKDVAFHDEFLKNWLKTREDKTKESIEEDYPKILNDLKFHIAKEKIVEANDIKVEREDLEAIAAEAARAQLAQYGMNNMPEELLKGYVAEMLGKEETVRGIYDRAVEMKLIEWMKEIVTVTHKEVSTDEFTKLLNDKK